jgi:16S rRNA (cytidine1402-2'-O)-methyltransferase
VSGRLVLVATPIGHLGDLSPRAAEALAAADLLCCEDTRRTAKLYSHLGIARPTTVVVNEHTEHDIAARAVAAAVGGATVVLVSDAGTPAISDPGERLVRAAIDAGITVTIVPGPSAVVAAVAISGLRTQRFVMEGFLPRSGRARTERLAALRVEQRTIVLYEAPHRLARTLTDLVHHLGPDRVVSVVRELTKIHEQVWRGTLSDALVLTDTVEPRGEYVVVVDGAPVPPPADEDTVIKALRGELQAGRSRSDAAATVAAALGMSRRKVYAAALELD